ncbi:MAG: hypothetical protein KC656_29930, partial [Myxococcales bacterium]|nr:hypothetical protein [Myxococcales bacterium]
APEPEEPAPVPVFVDCVDGYGHGRPVGLPDGRIVIHGGGYPSLGGTAMVSTDDGATFDRIQGLFMEGPWVAGDTLFYRGGTGSPGLVAILPDGSRVGAGPVDQPGRVVDGATEIWAAADRRLAWFEDGWVRYSDDAGATWRTVDGGTYRVLANDGGTFRGSRGLVPGPDGLGSYSTDGGVTWERFTFQPYENPREIELFGESGMLFDGQPFEVSHDHGVTWTSTGIQGWPWQVGPGADEIWIASENEVPGFLHHTEDGGLTWARRTLVAGDAGTLDVSFMGAVVLDSQGRRVFLVVTAAGDGPWSGRDLRCTETPSGGSMRTVRDIADTANTPESVAWWSESAPVPMPGRGEKAAWTGHWQNAYETTPWVVDYVRDPVWVDRTPEGDLLFLLRPEGGVDGQYGPPMRILRVDGTDANTIVGGYAFENLTNGAGLNAPSLYLEADRFEMLPDGRIFVQTANGSYDITRQRGSQVPMPGEGRWGLRGGEPVYLQVPPR